MAHTSLKIGVAREISELNSKSSKKIFEVLSIGGAAKRERKFARLLLEDMGNDGIHKYTTLIPQSHYD